ncbi:Mup1p [Sugiyamaella lignohabitans]|uniref:Mup1p n=1 Tax=Sugiyamaella lignohabitans TaxID=796027 RepID=A0A167F083_9ASCO|nr:Mup1p [Sugiyamaella lignohabitans]ANB14662.1 Mup1p [Sugiyamaella lignohabitans]
MAFWESDKNSSTQVAKSDYESQKSSSPDSEIVVQEGGIQVIAPETSRSIGVVSATFLIFNRMIGTGIFATPGTIFGQCGSVGLTLFIWVVGALISAAGLMVYLEWGSMIPKNGAEKAYLEYFYRKPRLLMTSLYGSYMFFMAWAASNSIVCGQYLLLAGGVEPDRWNQRGVGLGCITFAFLVHGLALKWGLRIQNVLGIFKLIVIVIIVVIGWVAMSGRLNIERTHAFHNAFENTNADAYGIVNALYNVMWSFIGYSNANYALAETKNPHRILKIAAPLAITIVTILYMFVNLAYFAVVPRDQILNSGTILAGNFFGIVWGKRGETAMSVFVALSALGNVMAVIFSQGRIVQELGREGSLPFSRFFASSRPLNSPLAGLFEHWLICVIIILAVPPGDAYNFLVNLISYPYSIVNAFVALALIVIYINKKRYPEWNPPIKASLPVTVFFFLSSVYLIAAPYVPPRSAADSVYKSLPYYLHCVVAWGIFAVGGIYWLVWARIIPRIRGYTLDFEEYVDDDGWAKKKVVKIYKSD